MGPGRKPSAMSDLVWLSLGAWTNMKLDWRASFILVKLDS